MNIQFTNWQAIHLQEFSNSFNGQFGGINVRLAEVDSVLGGLSTQFISIDDGNNSAGFGMWGQYQLTVRGSGFLSSANPVATSFSLVDPFNTYSFNGAINITNNFAGFYGITGGTFSSISTLFKEPAIPSSNYSYSINGRFIYSPLGRVDGGTVTSVTTSNNSFSLKGNLSIDANEVITGGVINEISYKSPTGESFLITNASIPYLTLIGLIPNNPAITDFTPIINFLTSSTSLSGSDVITGDAQDNILDGGTGIDRLVGGLGNDKYIVDLIETGATATLRRVGLQDSVIEGLNAGTDTLELRGNFNHVNATTITLGANLENLDASATETTKLNLTGNALNNVITGNDADNFLLGALGNDELNGGSGNDTLDGGVGNDVLKGGADNDTYLVDIRAVGISPNISAQLQDDITENAGEGTSDTLKLRGSVVIPAAAAATNIALTGALANIENLDISATGTTRLNLTGNAENNFLTGNAANNILSGGDGMDILFGGAGADTMIGGLGIDTYVVDNKDDVVIEQTDEGTHDLINSFISFDLNSKGANVEYLILIGQATIGRGNDLNNGIFGNSLANLLSGGAGSDELEGRLGNDILDGGTGADTMNGGDGNDTYFVDDAGDTVTENNSSVATGGTDTVNSSVNDYELTANVENLNLTGASNINGTGNALNNSITGNAGNNELDGAAGNDILIGGNGNDILTGGAGIDKLNGGKGNDTYNIDLIRTSLLATSSVALQDSVSELANPVGSTVEGIDTINLTNLTGNLGALTDFSNITKVTTLTVNSGIENFNASQTGSIKLNITGNALENNITGNAADNILDGGLNDGKRDTLAGGAGNDTYIVDLTRTPLAPAVLTGAQLQDVITENAGEGTADMLKLRGSVLIPVTTTATEIALEGALANIENLDISSTGVSRLNITGNSENNILTGNAANNIINGGAGADTMIGGLGDDTYVIDNTLDAVFEQLNQGIDTVNYNYVGGVAEYTLSANFENLTVGAGVQGRFDGNSLNNYMIGNSASILTGKEGNDTLVGASQMLGGAGNDLYIINGSGQTANETSSLEGFDRVEATVDVDLLGQYIENLTLLGGAIIGNGNDIANTITGNSNNNILDGFSGNDTIFGGLGDDTLIGSLGNDILNGGAGQDFYVFNTDLDATNNKDTIQGFNVLEDLILLDYTKFNAIGSYLEESEFRSGAGVTTASTANQHIIFNTSTGALYYDADGVGGTAAIQFATLTNTLGALNSFSFLLGIDFSQIGTDQADTLNGTSGDDAINGLAGNDIINGGAGADIMYGDLGDDTFYVDNADDIVFEDYFYFNESNGLFYENGNTNTIYSSVSYTADFGIGNLTLTGSDNINGYGSNLKINVITGNDGNNILDGGVITNPELMTIEYMSPTSPYIFYIFDGGLDTLIGGKGDDTYIVRGGETIIENANEGIDTYILSYNTGIPTAFLIDPASEIENFILANDNVLHDNISGTNKDNLIVANNIANNIYGLAGNDELKGMGGDDKLFGMSGNDILWGGTGRDTFVFESAGTVTYDIVKDFVSGQDKIRVSDGIFFRPALLSGIYTDMFFTGTAAQDGNDYFIYNKFTGDLYFDEDGFGANTQQLIANFLPNTILLQSDFVGALNTAQPITIVLTDQLITGSAFNDSLAGGAGNDTINAGAGNDTLNGGDGNDKLNGEADNDTIYGMGGDDTLNGGSGSDILNGGDGNDTINGNEGDDVIISVEGIRPTNPFENYNVGSDRLDGGEGSDIYSIINSAAFDFITDTGLSGTDEIRYSITPGGDGAITLPGSTSGVDKVILGTGIGDTADTSGTEQLSIFAFDVGYGLTLVGNNGNNQINATNSNDTIYGGGGNDTFYGLNGNDLLIGGTGNDTLTGSLGADTFKWELSDKGSTGATSIDSILDFNLPENDVLDLRDLLQGESTSSGNLLSYLDIATNGGNTDIRISTAGNFSSGNYNSGNEDARIVLNDVNLFTATGTSAEADLLATLIAQNKLIIDV